MNNKNPKVYLIKIINEDKSLYKIGFTRGSIYKRIRELQTGCPYQIIPVSTYLTDDALIIEKSLHNRFSTKKTWGEWFELGIEEEVDFIKICKKYEENQKLLRKNKID